MRLILSKREYKRFNTSEEYKREIKNQCKEWFDKGIDTIDLVHKRVKVFKTVTPLNINSEFSD